MRKGVVNQLLLGVILLAGSVAIVFAEEGRDPVLEKRIAELTEALTVRESDVTKSWAVSDKKKKEMENAAEELRNIGAPAVPALIEMTRLASLGRIDEQETGNAAARILIAIGPQALPCLEKPEYKKVSIIQRIIKEINRKGVGTT